MKRSLFLITSALFMTASSAIVQKMVAINFDQDKAGALPKDFTATLTGNGREGVWAVAQDGASPGQKNVLA